MTVLVIAEHDNAALNAATLNVVTAAKAIGGDIEVLVAGEGCGAVAEAAAKVDGVSKVVVADNAAYKYQIAENMVIWLLSWVKATATFWLPLPLPVKIPASRCSSAGREHDL